MAGAEAARQGSPERETQLPDRHKAVCEAATGNEWHDTDLERRAERLEKMLHQGGPSPLVTNTWQQVEMRLGEAQPATSGDRIRIAEQFTSAQANERVISLLRELQNSDRGRQVTLAQVMGEAIQGMTGRREAAKALGMRILQLYAPSGKRDAWQRDNFGESRKQRVRLGEMLVVSGQVGDLTAELKEANGGAIKLGRAKRYYVQFGRYVLGHDVPSRLRQALVEAMGVLERQHPLLANPPEKLRLKGLSRAQKQKISEQARRVPQPWPAFQEPIRIFEAEVVDESDELEAEDLAPVSEVDFMSAREEGVEDESSHARAEAREQALSNRHITPPETTTIETVSVEADEFWYSPERRAAQETIKQWRAAGVDLSSVVWLRPILDRAGVNQRYVELLNNELGYRDVLKERGVLNGLTSRWIEPMYTRMVVNPFNPLKWFSRSGKEEVRRARSGVITALWQAKGMRELDSLMKSVALELANQYEEINAIERREPHYYRERLRFGQVFRKPWFGRRRSEVVGSQVRSDDSDESSFRRAA